MWYNAGIRNNQRAFIHFFYSLPMCVCVCVTLTDLPPFPPLPSSNQTDKELKVRIQGFAKLCRFAMLLNWTNFE